MNMSISVTLNAADLKGIIADYLTKKNGGQVVITADDVHIQCKTKYNVNAPWEGCEFRATVQK